MGILPNCKITSSRICLHFYTSSLHFSKRRFGETLDAKFNAVNLKYTKYSKNCLEKNFDKVSTLLSKEQMEIFSYWSHER